MRDLVWIADHLDDVESDMSAIHRVDDIRAIPLERFFKLADRLIHYPGAVRDVVQHDLSTRDTAPQAAPVASTTSPAAEVPEVTSLAQVKALRAAARLRRYPTEKFGEHKVVALEDLMAEVNGSG